MQKRARAERVLGRSDVVRVTIDHVQHELSIESFTELAADTLRVLGSVNRERSTARAQAARCSDSPACARRGCADCERSYGPQRGRR